MEVGRSAEPPAVAYGDVNGQRLFFVVWSDDRIGDDKKEIHGQFIDATDASFIDSNFQISNVGHHGVEFDGIEAAVVFNDNQEQFLVTWRDDRLQTSNVISDIFGRIIDGVSKDTSYGAEFRIAHTSDVGAGRTARNPALAWNYTDREYMVVWEADQLNGNNNDLSLIHI